MFGATSVRHTRLDPVVTLLVNMLIAGTALNPSVAPLAGGAVGSVTRLTQHRALQEARGRPFGPARLSAY